MKQKIRDVFGKMSGMKKVIFEVFFAMIWASAFYIMAYWVTGDAETTVYTVAIATFATFVVVTVVAFVVVTFATFATFAAAFVATFATTFATFAVVTFATTFATVVTFATFATFAIFVAIVAFIASFVSKEYKIKYWKMLVTYLVEGALIYLAFSYVVPYLAIILLCVCTVLACVLIGLTVYRNRNIEKEK